MRLLKKKKPLAEIKYLSRGNGAAYRSFKEIITFDRWSILLIRQHYKKGDKPWERDQWGS